MASRAPPEGVLDQRTTKSREPMTEELPSKTVRWQFLHVASGAVGSIMSLFTIAPTAVVGRGTKGVVVVHPETSILRMEPREYVAKALLPPPVTMAAGPRAIFRVRPGFSGHRSKFPILTGCPAQ